MKCHHETKYFSAKNVVFAACTAAAAFSLWWMSMNYMGYCHSENKYLSDGEISERIMKNMPNDFSKYEEINCCFIDRAPYNLINIPKKILGEKNISAVYEAFSRVNQYHNRKLTYLELSNCGEILSKLSEHK